MNRSARPRKAAARLLPLVFLLPWTARAQGSPSLAALERMAIPAPAVSASLEDQQERASKSMDGVRLHPAKGIVTRIAVPLLHAAFKLDKALSPHEPFTRDAQPVDPRPLHEQAAEMEQDIRNRFLAEDDRLFLYEKPMSLGDMAIWQGNYTAAAVLKFKRERDSESQYYAEQAFDGLEMMYRRGLPIVRGILPAGMDNLDAADPRTRTDGKHQWQEDASIDSASGWIFGLLLAERHLPSRRRRARELLKRFTDDLIANDFHLKNGDGSNTRFGNMGHGLISPPAGVLMSLAVLAYAAQNYADPRYREALETFADKRQDIWGSIASIPTLWRNSSTNQNIGFLALASAILAEQDAERWMKYARGMIRLAEANEATGNSFWLTLTYWTLDQRPAMTAFHSDDRGLRRWLARREEVLALAKKSLLEFRYPRSKQAFETLNSKRPDLRVVRWPLSGKKTVAQPLPVWQRPAADFVWQRNAYSLDDWQGSKSKPRFEFTGLDFLLAYYLSLEQGSIHPDE